MTHLRSKLIRNLTTEEIARCRRLTSVPVRGGGMRDWLTWLRKWEKPPYRARAFMVEEDGALMAWALTYVANGDSADPGAWVHVYARKSSRRRGYGSRALRAALRAEPDAKASCYTQGSRAFYLAHGFNRLVSPRALAREKPRRRP